MGSSVVLQAWNRFRGRAESVEGVANAVMVATARSANEGEFRTAYAKNGGEGVVPDSDLSSAPASGDLIAWTGFAADDSHTVNFACAVDAVAGNTVLGWWYTVNAGSAVIARQRLREALDTASGIEVAVYTAGSTIDADENKGSGIVAKNTQLTINSPDAINDIYVVPVSSAASVVGNSILTAVVS